jgi:hypothetical protein
MTGTACGSIQLQIIPSICIAKRKRAGFVLDVGEFDIPQLLPPPPDIDAPRPATRRSTEGLPNTPLLRVRLSSLGSGRGGGGLWARLKCTCAGMLLQQPENQPTTPNDMPPSAPQRRPFRPHFTYLYRLVLTRSRWPELAKANHFLAHLALLVGPEALSRPATAQNSLGRGRSPPLRPPPPPPLRWGGGGGGPPPPPPPPAPPPPPRLGYAQPESSAFGGR